VIDVVLMIFYLELTEIIHKDIHSFDGRITQKGTFVKKTDEKDVFSVLKSVALYIIIKL